MTELSQDKSQYIAQEFSPERIDYIHSVISDFNKSSLAAWVEVNTDIYELGGQRFRMLVDEGEDPDKALVIGGEFGNGRHSFGSVARALIIRELVDPSASLILQPNTTIGESNTNFSKQERQFLTKGNPRPLVDRFRVALDENSNPGNVVTYGPSQGGVAMLALASTGSMPPVATAVMETPNVLERSQLDIAKDFIGAGTELKATILANYEAGGVLGEELVAELSLIGFAKYGLGLALPDNRALVGIIRRNSASEQISTILKKGGGIVHAWATSDSVSPASENASLAANRFTAYPWTYGTSYEAVSFDGDHSITNNYLLNAAIVNHAQKLMRD